MPTASEFRQFAAQARCDADEYDQWAAEATTEKMATKYAANAEKRRDDARFYERQATEKDAIEARRAATILEDTSE